VDDLQSRERAPQFSGAYPVVKFLLRRQLPHLPGNFPRWFLHALFPSRYPSAHLLESDTPCGRQWDCRFLFFFTGWLTLCMPFHPQVSFLVKVRFLPARVALVFDTPPHQPRQGFRLFPFEDIRMRRPRPHPPPFPMGIPVLKCGSDSFGASGLRLPFFLTMTE